METVLNEYLYTYECAASLSHTYVINNMSAYYYQRIAVYFQNY